MIEKALEAIADKILKFDEASMQALWDKYRARIENFEPTKDWERSVIIFFIINAMATKNQWFNDHMMKTRKTGDVKNNEKHNGKRTLRRVK